MSSQHRWGMAWPRCQKILFYGFYHSLVQSPNRSAQHIRHHLANFSENISAKSVLAMSNDICLCVLEFLSSQCCRLAVEPVKSLMIASFQHTQRQGRYLYICLQSCPNEGSSVGTAWIARELHQKLHESKLSGTSVSISKIDSYFDAVQIRK